MYTGNNFYDAAIVLCPGRKGEPGVRLRGGCALPCVYSVCVCVCVCTLCVCLHACVHAYIGQLMEGSVFVALGVSFPWIQAKSQDPYTLLDLCRCARVYFTLGSLWKALCLVL